MYISTLRVRIRVKGGYEHVVYPDFYFYFLFLYRFTIFTLELAWVRPFSLDPDDSCLV